MNTGIALIADERERQITKEGYSYSHDDKHDSGDLAKAAACYALCAAGVESDGTPEYPAAEIGCCYHWPWPREDWKPDITKIRNLVKAGALIAAEIDRLQRKASAEPSNK